MIGTTDTDARRLSRRALLSGFAAAAGAALLAACGGSATATPKTAAATTAAGAATTASGQAGGATTAPSTGASSAAVATTGTGGTTAGSTTAPSSTTAPASTSAASSATTGTRPAGSTAAGTTSGTTAASSAVSSTAGKFSGTIRVGSKDFTEEFIVGNMYALLIEAAGGKVDRKINLGGTPVCQAAMQSGDLDLYPEYTGTGLLTVLKLPSNTDAKMVYDQVAKGYKDQFNFVWLDPAPMNDTQALAMTAAGSTKFGVTKISDIVPKASQLTMIGPPEFEQREDGLPGIMKAYGNFKLKQYIGVDPALKYKGLIDGQADIAVAFSTDGDIAVNKLVVLQDDKKLFPIYQITPVVTQKALDASPGIRDALNKVAPMLTDTVMSTLNYEVDGKKREPADVAKEFLTNQGLLKK
ncbi:MAG TPA: glycine betaine ABC transporter substrate-binding protein [Thermomicrobiales bacterium]